MPSDSSTKPNSHVNIHSNSSSLTTTSLSSSTYPVRGRISALVEGLKSPSEFQSTTERNGSNSTSMSDDIPPIQTVAGDSTSGRVAGKVAIITGANSPIGIGRAAAYLYAQNGARALYLCDYDDEYLSRYRDQIRAFAPKCDVHPVKLDVSDEKAVKEVCEDAVSRYGRLDIMFANAGISGVPTTFDNLEADDFMQVMKINALGVFLCFKHAALAMKKTCASKARSGGSLIGTASVAGLRSNAGGTDYSASKAAVVSMAQTFAYQLVGTGIRANAICPGLTETGMTGPVFEMARRKGTTGKIGQLNPLKRGAVADEVARVALFLGSDEASYVNGQAWAVCGGLSAGHPFVPGKMA